MHTTLKDLLSLYAPSLGDIHFSITNIGLYLTFGVSFVFFFKSLYSVYKGGRNLLPIIYVLFVFILVNNYISFMLHNFASTSTISLSTYYILEMVDVFLYISLTVVTVICVNIYGYMCLYIYDLVEKSAIDFKTLLKKSFIIFTIGYTTRSLVFYLSDVNVFLQYNDIVSIIYYSVFSIFVGLISSFSEISFNFSEKFINFFKIIKEIVRMKIIHSTFLYCDDGTTPLNHGNISVKGANDPIFSTRKIITLNNIPYEEGRGRTSFYVARYETASGLSFHIFMGKYSSNILPLFELKNPRLEKVYNGNSFISYTYKEGDLRCIIREGHNGEFNMILKKKESGALITEHFIRDGYS